MAGQRQRKARRQEAFTQAIHAGVEFHRRGMLSRAESVYADILNVDGANFHALRLLAVLRHAQGNGEEALALVDQALRANRGSVDALSDRAAILLQLARPGEALATCERALVIDPSHALAWNNRGNALAQLGRLHDALASYDKALALKPDWADACSNRGGMLHDLGRLDEAISACQRALAIDPNHAMAWNNLGNTLAALARLDEAVASYEKALAVNPSYDDAWNNLGQALARLGRREEARASYEKAIALNRRNASAWTNRGDVLHRSGRSEEALASCNTAIEINPELDCAWSNRGNALADLGQFEEALASFTRALVVNPDHAAAHFGSGMLRLAAGEFSAGWPQYEWRWKLPDGPRLRGVAPQWRGEVPLSGKTILLHAEQGLGDTIQFIRYVPLVARQAGQVLLCVQPSLDPVMPAFPDNVTLIGRDAPISGVDFECPLLSLPLALGTDLGTILAADRYIEAPGARIEHWAQHLDAHLDRHLDRHLGPRPRLRIGLVWAGSAGHMNDRNRSVGLDRLLPLLAVPDIQVVSLQREPRAGDDVILREHPQIVDLGRELADFGDTAAVISLLDLVITVDTSVAHLAGAMGKPVRIALPFGADWRWLRDRSDSPWYPSARLFRQPSVGDWDSVVEQMAAELRNVSPADWSPLELESRS